jgi:hypothetical protein
MRRAGAPPRRPMEAHAHAYVHPDVTKAKWTYRMDVVITRQLRHWKRKRTIARKLIKLGVKRDGVWRQLLRRVGDDDLLVRWLGRPVRACSQSRRRQTVRVGASRGPIYRAIVTSTSRAASLLDGLVQDSECLRDAP